MNRQRILRLPRTCDDTTCGVCSSRWWDVCVPDGGAWRCTEWPRRPMLATFRADGLHVERLPECIAAEVRH